MKQGSTILGAAILAATGAQAQSTDTFNLDTIVISAGLEETQLSRTGVSISVITEEDLEKTGELRVQDYLARLPGVSVRSTGPLGTQAGLTIRGISQNNIAVRIDGIDVSDPSGPQVAFDFGGLTTGDISRIEVVRGSQSALFGSEAIGGVVNITTKRATEIGNSISGVVEYGSFNTIRSNLTGTTKSEGYSAAVNLSYIQSDGYSAADKANGNTEKDGYEARRLSFATDIALGDAATLEVAGFIEDSTFDYDEASGGVVSDGTPDDVTDKDQFGIRAALKFSAGMVENEISVSHFNIDRRQTGTNSFGDFDFSFEGTRTTLGYQGAMNLGPGRAVFGLEHVEETYADASSFGSQEHDTTITSVFGEYTFAAGSDVDLGVALRYDEHSEFGGNVTGRLSGVWRAREDILVRANLAQGFRAPSNYELYDTFSGNPDLEPESSLSFDLGVEKRYGTQGFVSATAFYIEAEDIIDYSFTTFGYVQRPGTSTRQGIELLGGWSLSNGMELSGSYTFTDSESDVVLDSSSWTTAFPEHALEASLSMPLGNRGGVVLTGLYNGDRTGLDDFAVFNATFTYEVTDSAEAYLRVENLFDEDYQTVPGYGTPERSFFAGVRATF